MNRFQEIRTQYLIDKGERDRILAEHKKSRDRIIAHIASEFRQIIDDGSLCGQHLYMEEEQDEFKHTLSLCKQKSKILEFQVKNLVNFKWTIRAYIRSDDTCFFLREGSTEMVASKLLSFSNLPDINNLYDMLSLNKEILFDEVELC